MEVITFSEMLHLFKTTDDYTFELHSDILIMRNEHHHIYCIHVPEWMDIDIDTLRTFYFQRWNVEEL